MIIRNVDIYTPNGVRTFEIGRYLIRNEVPTQITCDRIIVTKSLFSENYSVTILFSDGNVFKFTNLPFSFLLTK